MKGIAISMKEKHYNLLKKSIIVFCSSLFLLSGITSKCYAAPDYEAEAKERKNMTVETNEYINWPTGPEIGAQSAILMDIRSGAVLYAKNIDEKLYPASITKILTALIAYEQCDMDEKVTFSYEAVHSIDWRQDANMGINAEDSITMEQCLYGLLVGSANEAAYAIAEHICGKGNVEQFSELMNEKAAELGCTNSHFVTPNGIHDDNHYTSAHDMALIAQAFFSNELLTKMASTTSYHVPKTPTQPREDMIVYAKSKLLPGKEYSYEPLLGTKTGYTEHARQTLVSCAEKNGLRLVCVILKEETPYQFTDTIELFEYGFNNFVPHFVSEEDTTYAIDTSNFFSTDMDFFGSSKSIVEIDSTNYIVLPINVDFEETTSELIYDNLDPNIIAQIKYKLNDIPVGVANVIPATEAPIIFDFGEKQQVNDNLPTPNENIIFINIKNIIIGIVLFSLLLIVIFMIRAMINNSNKYKRKSHGIRRYKNKSKQLDWKNFKP